MFCDNEQLCEKYERFGVIAGVDEAGRGPLAGAVIAGAVILDPNNPIEGLMDSKKISEKKRDALFDEIQQKALAWSIGRAEVEEIDEINILQASMLAMKRAVESLSVTPELVLVDGNRCPDILLKTEAVVKGDQLVEAISAGSILAKVARDREMLAFDKKFPQYGFAKHKGYPTKVHMDAIREHGVCEIHRKTFGPVKKVLSESVEA